MKKISKLLLVVLTVLLLSQLRIYADESDEVLSELNSIIPEDLKEDIQISDESGLPTFVDVFDICLEKISDRITAPLKTFITLLSIISVAAIYKVFSDLITNERLYHVFELSCRISISISVFAITSSGLESVSSFLLGLSDFSLALSPLLTSLCIASGNVGSAAVTSAGISIFVAICEVIFATILLSFVRVSFALSACSSLGDGIPDLSGVSMLIKRMFFLIIGFIVMLFCAVSTYQSIVSSGVDSISYRTVRFAVGNAVPVVGASLGESLRVVSGALTMLRSTVGGVGVCVILLLLVPCIVSLLLNISVLSISSSISRMFGLVKVCNFLDDIRSVYGHLIALCVSASFMIIFLLSVVSVIPLPTGGG